MNVSYGTWHQAWFGYQQFLERFTATRPTIRRVLEIGGGANPALSIEFIEKHRLEYTILDISAAELAKAPDGYLKLRADITDENLLIPEVYDFVFSKMLAEHVSSGVIFHKNVMRLLCNSGVAFHYFPTLYALPCVINRLLPESLGEKFLQLFQGSRQADGRTAKFKAYYSWCRGPLKHQIKRFEVLGYVVEEYIGFFGWEGYFKKFRILENIHCWVNRKLSHWMVRHPIPLLTSCAYLILRKNDTTASKKRRIAGRSAITSRVA